MAQRPLAEPLTAAFERLRHNLRRMAARIVGDDAAADDALQDAFVKLWCRHDAIATEDEAAALVTTTVKHLSIDRRRRQAAAPQLMALDEDRDAQTEAAALIDDADEAAEAEARYREVEVLMQRVLTPAARQILHWRDYEGVPYADIAHRLHMSETAVRMQLSRARKAVRQAYLDGTAP